MTGITTAGYSEPWLLWMLAAYVAWTTNYSPFPIEKTWAEGLMLLRLQRLSVLTVYCLDEIAALCEIAHERSLAVHMDGARFANTLVRLDATPAR